MINYKISKPYPESPDFLRIENEDKNPIITRIDCNVIREELGKLFWSVRIEIKNETRKIRRLFYTVPDVYRNAIMGRELLVAQKDIENIIQFFKIIQQVDPLPLKAFSEIKDYLTDFDLTELLNYEIPLQQVEQGNDSSVLEDTDQEEDHEALEKQDINHYLKILTHFPSTYTSLISAETSNQTTLETYYNESSDEDENDLNTTIDIDNVKDGLDVFIKLAHENRIIKDENRRLRTELEELREYKARNEEKLASEGTLRADQSADSNNNSEDDRQEMRSNRFF